MVLFYKILFLLYVFVLGKLSDLLDKSYLEETFIPTIQKRGAAVIAARKMSSAMSAANAVADHLHDWLLGTDRIVSMSVTSDGSYGSCILLVLLFLIFCKVLKEEQYFLSRCVALVEVLMKSSKDLSLMTLVSAILRLQQMNSILKKYDNLFLFVWFLSRLFCSGGSFVSSFLISSKVFEIVCGDTRPSFLLCTERCLLLSLVLHCAKKVIFTTTKYQETVFCLASNKVSYLISVPPDC